MNEQSSSPFSPAEIVIGVVSLIVLYIISRFSYPVFHTFAELFSIVIGFGLFMMIWNSRQIIKDDYLLFVGIAYFFVASIDLTHALAYKGINLFAGYGTNMPTQLWVASRYVQSLSLLAAPLFVTRRLRAHWTMATFAILTAVVLTTIFLRVFPDCYIEGSGLTQFKVISEYVISAILVCSLILLVKKRAHFDTEVLALIILSIISTIGSELAFTFYIGVYDVSNLIGHFLKIIAFYLIFKAIIQTGLSKPYSLLFRDLKQQEKALKESEEWLKVTLSSIGDAVIATDLAGNIIFMNTVAEEVTGWALKDAATKPASQVFNVVNEQTRREVESPITKVLREGTIVGLANHTILVRKNGTEVPIDDSGAPIRDADGNTIGVVLVFRDITERKKVEDHTSRLASFPDLNPNPILEADLSGEITFCNPAAKKVLGNLGADREDCSPFLPKNLGAILKDWDRTSEFTIGQEVMIKDRVFAETIHLVPQFGVARIYAREITKRKRAEEALQESQHLLRDVIDSAPSAIFLKDCDGKFITINTQLEKMLGMTREELKGKTDYDIAPKDVADDWRAHDLQVMKTGLPLQIEEIADLEDGHHVFLANKFPLLDSSGRIYGICAISHDITPHKRAEDALKTSTERLEILSSTASQLLASKEPQEIVEVLCRRVMEHLDCHAFFNYLVEEAGNRMKLNAYAGIPDETAREIYFLDFGTAVCGCVARDAQRIVAENIPTTPDIRTDLVSSFGIKAYACHPLFAQGRVIGTLSFGTRSRLTFTEDELALMKTVADQVAIAMERMQLLQSLEERADDLELRVQERTFQLSEAYESLEREIKEHNKAEEQLRQSQKMEAIGTLAGGIAHDFNNMLAAILGFTEMAIEDVPDRPDVERSLQNVSKAAMRARDLVKQILAFSRKTNYERIPLPLSPLIKETVKLLRASIPATIEIRVAVTAISDTVLAAPVEAQQILMNLATNASLAMQEKGGTLDINLTDIDFEPDSPVSGLDVLPGEYVQLMVHDTGIGMSPEIMKRVFEPFFTTREVGKGTGMGLAMVYGIVKDLQGTITVESELGYGSTFRVFLPKVKTNAKVEVMRPVEIPCGSERILFVDDEEMLVEWGKATLEKLGYKVTAMKDSREALKTFSMNPALFDLVITDHAMPQMAGTQLTKEILMIRGDIPIILCTGHNDAVSPGIAMEAGIRQLLMKPVAKPELAQAIRRALDGNQDSHK